MLLLLRTEGLDDEPDGALPQSAQAVRRSIPKKIAWSIAARCCGLSAAIVSRRDAVRVGPTAGGYGTRRSTGRSEGVLAYAGGATDEASAAGTALLGGGCRGAAKGGTAGAVHSGGIDMATAAGGSWPAMETYRIGNLPCALLESVELHELLPASDGAPEEAEGPGAIGWTSAAVVAGGANSYCDSVAGVYCCASAKAANGSSSSVPAVPSEDPAGAAGANGRTSAATAGGGNTYGDSIAADGRCGAAMYCCASARAANGSSSSVPAVPSEDPAGAAGAKNWTSAATLTGGGDIHSGSIANAGRCSAAGAAASSSSSQPSVPSVSSSVLSVPSVCSVSSAVPSVSMLSSIAVCAVFNANMNCCCETQTRTLSGPPSTGASIAMDGGVTDGPRLAARRKAPRWCQSVSYFTVPPRAHPSIRLSIRLRRSRSNTSTEYSLPGATQLSQVRSISPSGQGVPCRCLPCTVRAGLC